MGWEEDFLGKLDSWTNKAFEYHPWNVGSQVWGFGTGGSGGAAQPYNTLSGQLAGLSGDLRQFSGTQWDRSQQGLYGALGMTQPSTYYGQNIAYNTGPGPMERSFSYLDNAYRSGPQYSQNAYTGFQQALAQPSATSGTYGSQVQRTGGTTAQQSLYGNTNIGSSYAAGAYNPYQYSSPGAAERTGSLGYSQLSGPGMYEQQAGNLATQMQGQNFLGRLYSGDAGMGAAGGYATAGRSEGYRPTDTTWGQNYAAGVGQRMAGPTSTAQVAGGVGQYIQGGGFNGQEAAQLYRNAGMNDRAQGYYQGANQVQGFAGGLGKQLNDAGSLETFADKYLQTGSNPYLDRLREQGTQRMNAEAAARGKFKSAGTLDRIGNYNAAMDAESFKYAGDLAAQSQAAKQGRLGQAQGLAESSSRERMGQGSALQGLDQAIASSRMGQAHGLHALEGDRSRTSLAQAGALQSLGGQLDTTRMQREDALARAAGMASGESLANTGNQMQANQLADQTRLARLSGMSGLAAAADGQGLSALSAAAGALQGGQTAANQRLSTLGGLSSSAQGAELARLAGGMTAAGQADAGTLGRLGMGLNYAQGADQSTLAAALGTMNMSGQLDAATLQRLQAQMGAANQMDAFGYQGLAGLANSANYAQAAQQSRYGQGYDMLAGSDALRAGLFGGFYGAGMNASGSAYTDSINALANAYQMRAQGQMAQQQQPLAWLTALAPYIA